MKSDEYYDLYKRDADFKEYVDRWCKNHGLGLFEALQLNLLQEYAKDLKERKKK